jgi:hypothetical protein
MSLHLCFIGHLSYDVISILQKAPTNAAGGGIFFASIAANTLLRKYAPEYPTATVNVFSKCSKEHEVFFREAFPSYVVSLSGEKSEEKGTSFGMKLLPSAHSTSCHNIYPTENPDDRKQRMETLAEAFTETEFKESILSCFPSDARIIAFINPLSTMEMDGSLIRVLRSDPRVEKVVADAQGFLREVDLGTRSISLRDWSTKREYLPLIDVFKVDEKELRCLVGDRLVDESGLAEGLKELQSMGGKTIVLTFRDGVWLAEEDGTIHRGVFGPYTTEGRTGRGDTCTVAATLGLHVFNTDIKDMKEKYEKTVQFAANITTLKMQKAGPYE